MRELISGYTGFDEINRGVPLMSRALLSQRLRELTAEGVLNHNAEGAYQLTEAGHALEPVIRENGGPCWIRTSDQLVKSQLLYQLS